VLMRATTAVDKATPLDGQRDPPEEPAVGDIKSPLAAGPVALMRIQAAQGIDRGPPL